MLYSIISIAIQTNVLIDMSQNFIEDFTQLINACHNRRTPGFFIKIKLYISLYFQTNIPFLINVLEHPKFLNSSVDTHFIDENPQLFDLKPSQNRAQKLLNYLGTVLVNGPQTPIVTNIPPSEVRVEPPPTPPGQDPPEGLRAVLLKDGPEGFAKV